MNKNIFIIIVAAVMVLSSLAVTASYNGNTSAVNAIPLPSVIQGKAHVGNVIIYANGTVSNATEIGYIGNSYHLNNNLNGTLIDMRNNSVVSGNGFIINGMGKNGFNVTNASSVQISDFNVMNSTTGGYILNSKSVTVKDSRISAENYGIQGYESDHLSISADRIAVPTDYGIYINYANEVSVNSTYIYATTGYYTDTSTNMTAFNNDTFSASSYAIYFHDNSISNIVIANNTIRGNGTCPCGLFFSSYQTNNVKIVGNTLENFTSDDAIYVDSHVSSGYVISNNDFVNTSTSIFSCDVFNAIITGNHFTNVTCYAISAEKSVNIAVSGNTITNSYNAYFVYAEYSSDIKIQGNSISNTSTAIEFEYSSGITVSDNSIMKSLDDAVYLYSDCGSIDNVNVTGNAIKAGAYGIEIYAEDGTASNINISQNKLVDLTSYGIYIETDSGKNYTLDNNTILNSSYPIYIFHVIQNIRIDGNRISNLSGYAIYLEYGSAASISGNVISGFSGTYQYGIIFEYSTEGVISNNIINGNSSEYGGLGISVYYSSEFSIFGNTVRNSTYGILIEGSGSLSVFTNTVMNNPAEKETVGIYSYDNSQYSYYSNTVSGSNYSIYSNDDFNGLLYGNTFSNAHNYTIVICNSASITFYHNNFLNGSRIKTYISGSSNLVWNLSLPVGGNYWSNYSGTGTDGIGSTPYKVNGTSVDYLPLTAKWEGYTITFVETGLPIGTAWSVTLGSSSVSSKTQTVVFSPYAAQHISQDFTVARISGYLVSELTGQITLNGASQVITLTFTPVKYNVTFTETGLPSGTSWSVTIGSQTLSSSGTINFSLPNGTYNYTVGSVTGYHLNTATGSFQINAAGKTISVTFVQNKYTLLVTETGLPAGDSWTVNVSGSTSTSTGNSIEIYLVSGTYNITVTGPSSYNITLSTKSVTIDNANATVSAVFKNVTVTAKPSNTGALYEGLGTGVVVGAVVGILATMMYSGTWIFRKFRKGKGGTQ
jgi:parallel beta-helix repeat protein/putative cofactor-binding repeat protein